MRFEIIYINDPYPYCLYKDGVKIAQTYTFDSIMVHLKAQSGIPAPKTLVVVDVPAEE